MLFIIGQPRSGTSLLQQMVLSSADIVSFPEPWFMLPLIYTYKYPGISSIFNSFFANVCFTDFLKNIEDGHKKYLEYLGEFARKIYGMHTCFDVQYVLDKTPRYFHVIEDLLQIFTDAKIIVIKRNPLSVFSSILSYNFCGDSNQMLQAPDRLHDLITGPIKIYEAEKLNHDNLIFIKYEDLVLNPKKMIERLNTFLDGTYIKKTYEINMSFKSSTSIDTKSVHRHNKPVDCYLEEWKKSIDCRKKKILLLGYLKYMTPDFWDGYGYEFNCLNQHLKKHNVKFSICRRNFMYYVRKYFENML